MDKLNPDLPYATHPDIMMDGKHFCFAGKFDGHARSELERYVKSKGAAFTPSVSHETDYLVLGSQGIRCCSFSCCVRVVENALELKDNGASLQLIREADFIDVMDADVPVD